MLVTAFEILPDGSGNPIPEADARGLIAARQGFVWIDMTSPSEHDAVSFGDLGFHPLAIEDTISPALHRPKVERFGNHLFVIVHGINYGAESHLVETTELNMFIGPTYVVTSHNEPLLTTTAVANALPTSTDPALGKPDSFAHFLLLTLADKMMPMVDHMAELADELEEEAVHHPQRATLEGLLRLRRSANRLYRLLVPQRDAMETLSDSRTPIISEEGALYFRNLSDRIFRLEDRVRNLVDRADSAVNVYMSSVANRQNETMKTLSIVASIFLPMSLVAGIYGMNFAYMPELDFRWGYFAALGFMLFIGIGIASSLWLRSWLKSGRQRSRWLRPFTVEVTHLSRMATRPFHTPPHESKSEREQTEAP